MPTQYAVVPVEGEDYEGRQWGYYVVRNGEPYLHVTTGGTGACWNIDALNIDPSEQAEFPLHVCDLDSFVNALLALLYSPADKEHCERWEHARAADERPVEGIVVGDRQGHIYAALTGCEPVTVSSQAEFEEAFGARQPFRIPALETEPPRRSWWRRLLDTRARRS